MNLLVISACSRKKRYKSTISCHDIDKKNLSYFLDGKFPIAKAKEMYMGREHNLVKKSVKILREMVHVDWYIISAAFGLINENDLIVPYECTFNTSKEELMKRVQNLGIECKNMSKKEIIKKIGKKKGIENRLKELFNSNYDIIFFILGTNYLFTILDALKEIPEETRGIFFGSKRNMELIPETYFKIISSDREKNKLRTTLMELKGRQLLNVAVNVKKNPYLLYKIRNDRDLLYRLSLNAR